MSGPLVSAIIPAFNAEQFLDDAVCSVLDQTYSPVECVVVDDGSMDGTGAKARQYGRAVSYVFQENRGVSAARNVGAAVAKGDLLAFLDADDFWEPTRIARQLPKILIDAAAAVLCAAWVVDDARNVTGILRTEPLPTPTTLLLHEGGLSGIGSGLLMTRSAFEASGGFDARLSTSADWDFLFRLAMRERIAYVDEPLFSYRRHPGSMSQSVTAMEHDMELAYEKAFAGSPELEEIRPQAYARLHWMLAGSYIQSGSRMLGARHFRKALRDDAKTTTHLILHFLRRRFDQMLPRRSARRLGGG